jgi:hypothetical protein
VLNLQRILRLSRPEERIMEEQEKKETEEQAEKKKEETEPMPFCTTAPSPEHARAEDDDEPCDDSRSGVTS